MIEKRQIGNLDLYVTEIGIGTAPLGGWPIAVDEQKALETLETAWNKGIRYFDTAPFYGSGMSEIRLGKFLQNQNKNDFVISTKVGRLIIDSANSKASEKFLGSPNDKDSKFDYTYDGALRSFEDSLSRLELDKIDILYLHDPDNHPDHFEIAKKGAVKAMIRLREEGVVKAIGCGMNQNEMLIEFAKEGCFDCFLLAGRYTLIDQTSMEKLIPTCIQNNISIIMGSVFNSGILLNPSPETYFDYSKLDENWVKNLINSKVRIPKSHESADYWLQKAYKINEICKKFNLPIKQAAIQFPYANEVVSSCLLGMTSTHQVNENISLYSDRIDDTFWKYLKQNKLINLEVPN